MLGVKFKFTISNFRQNYVDDIKPKQYLRYQLQRILGETFEVVEFQLTHIGRLLQHTHETTVGDVDEATQLEHAEEG